jgi:segregation and condensation protein A
MVDSLSSKRVLADIKVDDSVDVDSVNDDAVEEIIDKDYSKDDLIDLIDQPEWKTILLGLVKTEKMDPWDIDVSELAKKYLKKINELEHSNLRVPANAILACAILLKTKSKNLKLSSIEDDVDDEQLTDVEQNEMFLDEIPDLMANRAFREGKISLDELVSSIENIIDSSKPKKNRLREMPKMELNLDGFSIEDMLDEVFDIINKKVDSQGIVLFNDLIRGDENPKTVETFLAVLFLMTNGKVHAYQTEFFGDIFIQLIKDNALLIDSEVKVNGE